jgi:hypothetical protein
VPAGKWIFKKDVDDKNISIRYDDRSSCDAVFFGRVFFPFRIPAVYCQSEQKSEIDPAGRTAQSSTNRQEAEMARHYEGQSVCQKCRIAGIGAKKMGGLPCGYKGFGEFHGNEEIIKSINATDNKKNASGMTSHGQKGDILMALSGAFFVKNNTGISNDEEK